MAIVYDPENEKYDKLLAQIRQTVNKLPNEKEKSHLKELIEQINDKEV